MKIEIWSDVMCPFCYIGKRNFENALSKFANRDKIEIEWKSFQLDPGIKNGETPDYKNYLAKRKGLGQQQVTALLEQVTEMAAKAGLKFHFEKAVVANSFDAHRLSHFALEKGKQNEVKELLFAAHFSEGKDISDHGVLGEAGQAAGLNAQEILSVLKGKTFSKEVLDDIEEAGTLEIQGVPYFVFDRKYAISGAQPSDNFLQVLQKAFAEWQKEN